MPESSICKAPDHLFLPVLEVQVALLRCVHCNVFAYHETVKQLAKRRGYTVEDPLHAAPESTRSPVRFWRGLVRACVGAFMPTWLSRRIRATG